MAAGVLLATAATAQTAAPPPPPPPSPSPPGGGLMRADANGDGIITRAEMITDAQARFDAMDTNKDGKVTPEERDAAREAMRAQWRGGAGGRGGGFGMRGGGGGGDATLTRAEAVERAGARFDRLDTNHDGKLDATERAAMRPMGGRRGAAGGGDMPPPPPPPPATPAR
ncbi:MAG: hypothetical protein PGN08_09710 [Sphingomonas taxi]